MMTSKDYALRRQREIELLYGCIPHRVEIPGGRYCNYDLQHWCKYLYSDYCMKYGHSLMSTCSGIGGGHSAQVRCMSCRQEFKQGDVPEQLSLFDLLLQ